jgi:hypothetical protein
VARAAGPGRWPGCPAMLAGRVAPRNSLRSLRSLRSDNRGGLDHEVRCAHRPRRLRFSAAPTRPIAPLPAAWRHAAAPGAVQLVKLVEVSVWLRQAV